MRNKWKDWNSFSYLHHQTRCDYITEIIHKINILYLIKPIQTEIVLPFIMFCQFPTMQYHDIVL